MKNKARFLNKVYRKIHWFIYSKIKPGKWIRCMYASYRHRKKVSKGTDRKTVYITQVPNEGAGIGHQIANFIGGYHYSQLFNIPFAYPGFREKKWDAFLGFGENEISIGELKKQGYRIRKLPYFRETKEDISLINEIIDSYAGEKIILSVELDQFYKRQYDVIPYIKEKFEKASARKEDNVLYNDEELNIAMHIRRGDIVKGNLNGDETIVKRWLSLTYFENIVKCLKRKYKKEMTLYIFSQGEKEEYSVFEKYGKVVYCLNMDEMNSFLHMVRADILIISKSSFSYKPALLADGIRICPPNFWHDYPQDEKWVVTDQEGIICEAKVDRIFSLLKN